MDLDRTTRAEKLLTRFGMWGAIQSVAVLAAVLVGSVALLESLVSPAARLLPAVSVNAIHFFAVGIGLLAGLVGSFVGDFWDRVFFESCYGPRGRWLKATRPPLRVFPPGAPLKAHRDQAAQALPRRPEADQEIYREAAKVARRQTERWERIERPLILSRLVRGFIWPCLFVALLAAAAAVLGYFTTRTETLRLVATAGGCLALALLLLVPYVRLRLEHMSRLYRDVAAHPAKRKAERR